MNWCATAWWSGMRPPPVRACTIWRGCSRTSILEMPRGLDSQRRHAAHYESVLRRLTNSTYKAAIEYCTGWGCLTSKGRTSRPGRRGRQGTQKQTTKRRNCAAIIPILVVYVLDLRQHPRERIRWLKAALVAAQGLKWRDAEGAHLGNLGNAYNNLGEYRRAIEYYEQHLTIAREIGDRRRRRRSPGQPGHCLP